MEDPTQLQGQFSTIDSTSFTEVRTSEMGVIRLKVGS
jgi:hypothetical protein